MSATTVGEAVACPLCETVSSDRRFVAHRNRPRTCFLSCATCDLIFVAPSCRLDAAAERKRYECHNNSALDAGYVSSLQPTIDAVVRHFSGRNATAALQATSLPFEDNGSDSPSVPQARPAEGLDFGCGPAPVLVELLNAKGFAVRGYDPFFAPDATLLQPAIASAPATGTNDSSSASPELAAVGASYDFIVSTEVFEHLYAPGMELRRLRALLRPAAALFIATQLHTGAESFDGWWYARDSTHVCFFSQASFEWAREQLGFAALECNGKDMVRFDVPS